MRDGRGAASRALEGFSLCRDWPHAALTGSLVAACVAVSIAVPEVEVVLG
jgi:hypothetical protein